MSKIALSPSPTGSAVYTIASPAGSTDRTLTLPDAAGTVFVSGQAVTATTGNFSGNVTLGSSVLATPTGSAPAYLCRAWVNFNGTGTVAIRASGNVSSITDNGAGDYTVNFTTAMPDIGYTTQITTNRASVNTTLATSCRIADELTAYNVSNVRMRMGVPDSARVLTSEDSSFVCVAIFR